MVAGKKPYPKATLKKIVKAHAGMSIRKNTDITVWSWVTRFPISRCGTNNITRSISITFCL